MRYHGSGGRLLPCGRTFIAFPAGIARMPQLRFMSTRLSDRGRGFVLAYVGKQLATGWNTDPRFMNGFIAFHWW